MAATNPNAAKATAANQAAAGSPATDPVGAFIQGILGITGSNTNTWLNSWAGQIASGFEAGFVSLLTSLWNVIIGPLEIMAGVALAVLILMWAFRDDISQLAQVVLPLLAA